MQLGLVRLGLGYGKSTLSLALISMNENCSENILYRLRTLINNTINRIVSHIVIIKKHMR